METKFPTKIRPMRNPLMINGIISHNDFTADISSGVYLTLKLRRIIISGSYSCKKYFKKCIVDKAIHIAL